MYSGSAYESSAYEGSVYINALHTEALHEALVTLKNKPAIFKTVWEPIGAYPMRCR